MNILAERALNSVEQGLLNAPPSALGFKKKAPKAAPKTKSSRSRSKQQQAADAAEDEDGEDAAATDPADAARIEVESGTHQLETLLCASIDRNFDKFEIYVLRNILCVRPPDVRDWIRLSHYDGLDFSPAALAAATANGAGSGTAANGDGDGDGDVDMEGGGGGGPNGTAQHPHPPANPDIPTLDSINKLRRRLRESMRLNALLTAEHARNERLLADLRHLVGAPASSSAIKREKGRESSSGAKDAPTAAAADDGGKDADKKKSPFAFLHDKGDLTEAGPDAPLSTNTAFTLSQMQALRALSTSLRTMTPDLVAPSASTTTAPESPRASEGEENPQDGAVEGGARKKKTWRRERLEYVEAATRRHLESVQGLELGRDGGVRDGEWQGPGRALARGEVEGLERLASLLGGDAGDAGDAGAGEGGEDGGGDGDGHGDGGADRMDES